MKKKWYVETATTAHSYVVTLETGEITLRHCVSFSEWEHAKCPLLFLKYVVQLMELRVIYYSFIQSLKENTCVEIGLPGDKPSYGGIAS